MRVSQVWFETGVTLNDVEKGEDKIDALLSQTNIVEVMFYHDIQVLCDVSSDSDVELYHEIQALRSTIRTVLGLPC